ncbi:MAG: hypothetical protein A2474_03865 [Elusimicrobia bacterium RIFOXYC2_FULL_34_12]|nr:MAG: hypothetical protein A2474_03865 [Elusimicrobia bacterium RIFOXYC2_FULL_34_12]OGS38717.1 MAG: hypothetical protein A2551_03710 [Elusimicrobia bacterium RIFOXYD2_FULL_34_30]HAM39335.1 hypothetical protein [Elusimicrobiota bacterium]
MKNQLSQLTSLKTTIRQILGTRLTNIIKLSEKEFNLLIKELESDPLFEKLRNERIIRYKKFPNTGFSNAFLEFNENISIDHSIIDIGSILERKEEVIRKIKQIGIEDFKKHILYNDDNLSYSEIAEKCKVTVDEVKKIIDLLNEISIQSEFHNPSSIDISSQIKYNKIASIDKDEKGHFMINLFSPNMVRGRYELDYEKLKEIKNRKMQSLVNKLELINARKTLIYQILEKLISHQKDFLATGNFDNRRLLTQKDLSGEINIDPSIVSRIIKNRSVVIPAGIEISLQDFFSNKKDIKKLLTRKIIEKSKSKLSAEKIKQMIKKEFRVNISRRSVAYYLEEFKLKK